MTKLLLAISITMMIASCNNHKKPIEAKVELNKSNLLTISEPPLEFMEALISGTLTLDDNGCIKIGQNTIIWPYGYRLGENKNAIYNPKGNIVVEIGNHIQLSGGECSDCPKEHLRKLTGSNSFLNCTGSYWITGEQIKVK